MTSPTAPPYAGAPEVTRTLGYYNPYSYPFQLHVPELNRSILLAPNEFITVPAQVNGKTVKVKVNDPIFDNFVGANKLAKEEGTADVKILWLARPTFQPIPTHMYEYAGSAKFTTDAAGRVMTPEAYSLGQQKQVGTPASASCIAGYSIEQAAKLGVIKPHERGLIREQNETSTVLKTAPRTAAAPAPEPARRPTPPAAPPELPPFKAPVDDRVFKKTTPVAAPPVPKVAAGSSAALNMADLANPAKIAESIAPEQLPPPQLPEEAEDLLSDLPPSHQELAPIVIEQTDMAALSRAAAAAAGVTLPEPKIAEVPAAPVVAAVPPPAPARRSRRDTTVATPQNPSAA